MDRILLLGAVLLVGVAGPLYSSFYPLHVESEWVEECVVKDHLVELSEYNPVSGFYWVVCTSTGETRKLFVADEKDAALLLALRNHRAHATCMIEQKRRPGPFDVGEGSMLDPEIRTCRVVTA